MTTKHMRDNASPVVNQPLTATTDGVTEQAQDASRELLAKARYDAFQLMTEARNEAETILDEAKAEASGTRDATEIMATSTAEKATVQAADIVQAAHEEAATIVAGAHRKAGEDTDHTGDAVLKAEHEALSERVSTLRTIANQLEDRFAALAKTARPEPAQSSPPNVDPGTKIDYSPSVTPEPEAVVEADETPDERESFYNRRSANLPSIGDDGGRSALNMMRSMRQSLDTD